MVYCLPNFRFGSLIVYLCSDYFEVGTQWYILPSSLGGQLYRSLAVLCFHLVPDTFQLFLILLWHNNHSAISGLISMSLCTYKRFVCCQLQVLLQCNQNTRRYFSLFEFVKICFVFQDGSTSGKLPQAAEQSVYSFSGV